MKLSDAFPKAKGNHQSTVRGSDLWQWVERQKAGEINIMSMECVTKHNGSYKLFYNENSTHKGT